MDIKGFYVFPDIVLFLGRLAAGVVISAGNLFFAHTGDHIEFYRNFDENFLGDSNLAGVPGVIFFAVHRRFTAALGFDAADGCVWFQFNGNADVGILIANLFACLFARQVNGFTKDFR